MVQKEMTAQNETIITPAGSTIEAVQGGGYRVCDARQHCLRADSLWQAQQLVQWAEVHHRPLDGADPSLPAAGLRGG
jgi:hypothetical protein